jgi:hypothetical protein
MKQLTVISFIAAAVVSTSCTTVDYTSQDFPAQSADHQRIAVLPFEMVLVGRFPARLSERQILDIEEAESLMFQKGLYYSMLDRSSADRKHPIRIDIQPVERTNRLLHQNGIGIRESWAMPAEELAGILGVDAVVRTTVQKTRYLSDLESYGIDLGTTVLYEVTEGHAGWMMPFVSTTTFDIWADSTLIDGSDGDVLWKVALQRNTDWQRPADDVVLGITRKLARKFPYRV